MLTLSGCVDRNPGEARVLLIDDRPELVDPARSSPDEGDAVLMEALAQGLVSFDARGAIDSGLAERWHVSNDGRSYIFRLGQSTWPDGSDIRARDVASILSRVIKSPSNPLADSLDGVEDVVAMTDRVIEIRLSRPQPHLLSLLAQPELAILREGQGSGPFLTSAAEEDAKGFHLSRQLLDRSTEQLDEEVVHLVPASAEQAVEQFASGNADLVLGGTFEDLPYAQIADLPDDSLRYDPAIGLFGLMPRARSGPLSDPEVRALLSRSIDRAALVADLGVPRLLPRATLLQQGVEGSAGLQQPPWLDEAVADRQTAARRILARLIERGEDGATPRITLFLPDGPGADIVFNRLATDWGKIGFELVRTDRRDAADFLLVDQVAPSPGLDWFVKRFDCRKARICSEEVDTLLRDDDAERPETLGQRQDRFVSAARLIDRESLFLPLAAPIRWSLVGSHVTGFAPNGLARHGLRGLKDPLPRKASE